MPKAVSVASTAIIHLLPPVEVASVQFVVPTLRPVVTNLSLCVVRSTCALPRWTQSSNLPFNQRRQASSSLTRSDLLHLLYLIHVKPWNSYIGTRSSGYECRRVTETPCRSESSAHSPYRSPRPPDAFTELFCRFLTILGREDDRTTRNLVFRSSIRR